MIYQLSVAVGVLPRCIVSKDMTTQQIGLPYLHAAADTVIARINHHDVDKSEK